jgi:hypothetical protein
MARGAALEFGDLALGQAMAGKAEGQLFKRVQSPLNSGECGLAHVFGLRNCETEDSIRRRADVSRTARHNQLDGALFNFACGSE